MARSWHGVSGASPESLAAMQVLETERLVLGPPREDERTAIYGILVDEIEGETFTWADYQVEFTFDVSLQQQTLGQHFGRPAIFLKVSTRYIGYAALLPRLCTLEERGRSAYPVAQAGLNTIEAEVGWAISERYRNQGYASEAARALCGYGLQTLHLPRIVAFTEQHNVASQRVMSKIGMQIKQDQGSGVVVGVVEPHATTTQQGSQCR